MSNNNTGEQSLRNKQRPDRITAYLFLAFGILAAIMFAVLP
jgi:hypothetical protein